MKKITVQGISLEIDPASLDDLELLEALGEVEEGNAFKFPKVLKLMFGQEKYKEIFEALRDENGRSTATAASKFLQEVFEAVGQKNS